MNTNDPQGKTSPLRERPRARSESANQSRVGRLSSRPPPPGREPSSSNVLRAVSTDEFRRARRSPEYFASPCGCPSSSTTGGCSAHPVNAERGAGWAGSIDTIENGHPRSLGISAEVTIRLAHERNSGRSEGHAR